jgi:hypothetical protein
MGRNVSPLTSAGQSDLLQFHESSEYFFREDFSRKGAKAQSAAALLKGFSLRICALPEGSSRRAYFVRSLLKQGNWTNRVLLDLVLNYMPVCLALGIVSKQLVIR